MDSILSKAEPEKFCVNLPAPSAKAKYSRETDSELVLWRKGEKNPKKGSEKILKPYAYKRSEHIRYVTACLLHNEPTSYSSLASLSTSGTKAQRKRVWIGRLQLVGVDAKPGDLSMGRLKLPIVSEVEDRTSTCWKMFGWPVDRGERPIKPGDSSYSPKCI